VGIVSVSIGSEELSEIESLQRELGISGRSEIMRMGIKKLSSDQKELSSLSGNIDCVLLVVHKHDSTHAVAEIRHDFESMIRTQLHSHIAKDKCLEILVASGDSNKVKKMVKAFESLKKVDYVKLVVP